jgi:hypothetical protein
VVSQKSQRVVSQKIALPGCLVMTVSHLISTEENSSGGINEAGLAVELMWLDDAEYPADPRIPSFGTLEWIQYQLDQACHGQGCGGKRIPRLHRFGGEIALPGC